MAPKKSSKKAVKKAAPAKKPVARKQSKSPDEVRTLLARGCSIREYADALSITTQAATQRLRGAVKKGQLVRERREGAGPTALDALLVPNPPSRRGAATWIFRMPSTGAVPPVARDVESEYGEEIEDETEISDSDEEIEDETERDDGDA